MKNAPTTADSASEHERLLAETVALDRRGKVSQAQLAALEARIQKAIDEDDQRLAGRIATIGKQGATPIQPPSRGWRFVLFAMVIYPLAGLLFELTLGPRFVFAFAAEYWLAAPWIFLAALGQWMGIFLRAEVRQRLRVRYPSWASRWLLMVPLTTGLMAGLVVMATPGWAALMGWIAGGSIAEKPAKTVSIGSLSKRAKDCKQTGKFLIKDAVVNLCVEGRMAAPIPTVGDQVLLVGRTSWFGMFVNEVRRR